MSDLGNLQDSLHDLIGNASHAVATANGLLRYVSFYGEYGSSTFVKNGKSIVASLQEYMANAASDMTDVDAFFSRLEFGE
ncbi:hypothetical protein ACRQFN_09320 [Actinotignum sp. GS-2025e]|uniref:hypothetical protein n=1 Tax=unclassified Actinotignum TaxID=2632702 RepID=UPI003F4758BB